MPRLPIFLLIFCGCAGTTPYVRTYQSALIVNGVVEEAHEVAWSLPLNRRIDECEPKADAAAEADRLAVFDDCMGEFTTDNQRKVTQAVAAYRVAATTLSATLAQVGPEGRDPKTLAEDANDVVCSAFDLVRLFPKGAEWEQKIVALLPKGQKLCQES